MSDHVKKVVKCMKADENGNVEFVLQIDGEEKHFWPSQLAGAYIADRIEDVKNAKNTDNLNVVISVVIVFHSFT